jgi:peptidoglycan/LPS O-acetylase OafA/YrhL
MSSQSYRPEIDGLRAIAVLSVVLFHFGLGLPGGFIGVDVFFVLSGYLITKLLAAESSQGRFSLERFWARRIRRLMPALVVTIAVTFGLGLAVLLPGDLIKLGQAICAQSLLASNFYFWRSVNYFSGSADVLSLLHTWSLAVEEQFYLIFPLLFCYGWSRSPRATYRILCLVGLASLGLSLWLTMKSPALAFYLLPCRAWELLLGSWLALTPALEQKAWLRPASWLGLLALGVANFAYSNQTPFPGVAALVPCLATFVMVAGAQPGSLMCRMLSQPPLVKVGLISYSLYLWHWPLVATFSYLVPEVRRTFALSWPLLPTALLLAYASWKWVEQPWRQRGGSNYGTTLWVGFLLLLGQLGLGTSLLVGRGFPARFTAQELAFTQLEPGDAKLESSQKQVEMDQLPKLGEGGPLTFAVWGDSHAMALAPGFDLAARRLKRCGVLLAHSSTAPLLDYQDTTQKFGLGTQAPAFNREVFAYLKRHQIRRVILVGKWTGYQPHGFYPSLASTLQQLKDQGMRVDLILQVPLHQLDVPRALAFQKRYPKLWGEAGTTSARYANRSNPLRTWLRDNAPWVHVIDLGTELFGPSGQAILEHQGQALYRDEGHLSRYGSERMAPRLEAILSEAAQ